MVILDWFSTAPPPTPLSPRHPSFPPTSGAGGCYASRAVGVSPPEGDHRALPNRLPGSPERFPRRKVRPSRRQHVGEWTHPSRSSARSPRRWCTEAWGWGPVLACALHNSTSLCPPSPVDCSSVTCGKGVGSLPRRQKPDCLIRRLMQPRSRALPCLALRGLPKRKSNHLGMIDPLKGPAFAAHRIPTWQQRR